LDKGEITGCLLRYNRTLLDRKWLPITIECSGEGFITSYENVVHLLNFALEVIRDITGSHLEPAGKPDWQYIGRMYNLYSYQLIDAARNMVSGVIRLVEAGGQLVNISGVFYYGFFEAFDDYFKKKMVHDGKIVEGRVLENVFLRKVKPVSQLPSGQTNIHKQPVYAVEGMHQLFIIFGAKNEA
jgi:hypothetical protein